MSPKKRQLIRLFLQRTLAEGILTASLDTLVRLAAQTYNRVSKESIKEIREKYTFEEYITRVAPIVDAQFTEEELQKIITFYSSDVARKMFESNFVGKVRRINTLLSQEIEQEFAMRNAKI